MSFAVGGVFVSRISAVTIVIVALCAPVIAQQCNPAIERNGCASQSDSRLNTMPVVSETIRQHLAALPVATMPGDECGRSYELNYQRKGDDHASYLFAACDAFPEPDVYWPCRSPGLDTGGLAVLQGRSEHRIYHCRSSTDAMCVHPGAGSVAANTASIL